MKLTSHLKAFLVSTLVIGGFVTIANAAPVHASTENTFPCGASTYTVTDGVLSGGASCTGDLVIDSSVTSIGNQAFMGSGLTSVVIPDSVTLVEQFAFHVNGSLTSVVIGDGVITVGWNAFSYNGNLTSVTFGSSIASIASTAFFNTKLVSVVLPASVSNIAQIAFADIPTLTSVTIADDTLLNSPAGSIDPQAFYRPANSGDPILPVPNVAVYHCGNQGERVFDFIAVAFVNDPICTKATQSLTYEQPSDALMTDRSLTVSPSSDSGLPVTLSTDTPEVCTVADFDITFVAAGTCTTTARQSGDSAYRSASVSRSFEITKASQTIQFELPSEALMTDRSLTVSPSSDSGLPVSVTSSTLDICYVMLGEITLAGSGTCVLTASQEGNGDYLPASVERSFEISRAAQTIVFELPASALMTDGSLTVNPISYGGFQMISTGLPITMTVATPMVCSVSGFVISFIESGTCVVTANQEGDYVYSPSGVEQQVEISKAEQTALTLEATTFQIGETLNLSTSGGSGTGDYEFTLLDPGSAACSLSGNELSATSVGECIVEVSRFGDVNYLNVSTGQITMTVSAEPSPPDTDAPADTPNTGAPTDTPNTDAPTDTPNTDAPSGSTTTVETPDAPLLSVIENLPTALTPLVATSTLRSGQNISVTFSGFIPGEIVQLIVASTPQVIAVGTADANGSVTLAGSLPTGLASGAHTLAVYAPGSGIGFKQGIVVQTLNLPATGSSREMLVLAMVLMLLGLIVTRLRRRSLI